MTQHSTDTADYRSWDFGPVRYRKVGAIGFLGTEWFRFMWVGRQFGIKILSLFIPFRKG